jgi:hypothetical protein
MQTEDNVLEVALELAASEPAHRPEFFRLLLESTIFILGSSGQLDGEEGVVTLKAKTQIQLTNWVKPDGSSVIPFFSSLCWSFFNDGGVCARRLVVFSSHTIFAGRAGPVMSASSPSTRYQAKPRPATVSQLAKHLRSTLQSRFPSVWVEAKIDRGETCWGTK